MGKELLFSVTAADCDWKYERGTGPGGQKRNKTETKVRCTHRASGAVGVSDETRDQKQNKKSAFLKMSQTDKFKAWHKMEVARRTGVLRQVEERVEDMMNHETKIELFSNEQGKWVDYKENENVDD